MDQNQASPSLRDVLHHVFCATWVATVLVLAFI